MLQTKSKDLNEDGMVKNDELRRRIGAWLAAAWLVSVLAQPVAVADEYMLDAVTSAALGQGNRWRAPQ